MSIVIWIMLGLIAGVFGSLLVGGTGRGILVDTLVGVIGAVLGGAIFQYVGETGITGLDLRSVLVSIFGAVLVLVIYHAVGKRRLLA